MLSFPEQANGKHVILDFFKYIALIANSYQQYSNIWSIKGAFAVESRAITSIMNNNATE